MWKKLKTWIKLEATGFVAGLQLLLLVGGPFFIFVSFILVFLIFTGLAGYGLWSFATR